ncbi:MAG TPA: S24 family peptidase [Rubricoccaceae bacterium]
MEATEDEAQLDEEEVVEVPRYGHVGAGAARVPPKQVGIVRVSPAAYTVDFGEPPRVIGNRYAPSGRFGYFIIDGDSAAPVFFDRERVPVQLLEPERRFANDLLYVFRWQGEYQIKRLRLLDRNGRIRASSLNPSIDPFEFHVDEQDDFAVVALARMSHKQQIYTALVGRFLRSDP